MEAWARQQLQPQAHKIGRLRLLPVPGRVQTKQALKYNFHMMNKSDFLIQKEQTVYLVISNFHLELLSAWLWCIESPATRCITR
jgi:hypothetical protein